MRIAYFDCVSGISGDMTLGALVDAGVDPAAIEAAVAGLDLPGRVTFESVRRCGFRATLAKVETPEEHAHRHLHHIEAILDNAASLTGPQRELARRIFRKLGEAEARVHGIELRKVHFHEVGAVDSIIDIVGAAVGLDLLGVERIEASPVPTGRGWVQGAHGRMPVPAPATAELLKGIPLADSAVEMELTTPTGAAILGTVAAAFGPRPEMTVTAIGLGAGGRDLKEQPNVVRLFVGEARSSAETDRAWVLETNLDDLPGEIVGYTTARLLEAGALDVYVTPVLMKKNRPGVVLSVLCAEGAIPGMEAILFRETTTLGVRRHAVTRTTLARAAVEVATAYGSIAGKLRWAGGGAARFSPEYEACAEAALTHGVALQTVYEAAEVAARGRDFAGPPESHA